ncbi:hypothetical protein F7725_024344, partial [Dissostichus mawsoni]
MSPVRLKKSYYNNNPIIHNTIQIWRQITNQLKLRALSFNVPLSSNPSFTPSIMDGTFDRWRELGMGSVGDLYIRGTFASFQQLQEKYGLARADFFRYLQIRHFEIAEDTWDKALKYVSICSLNARHCRIQFKMLHRLHYSKVKLHRIFPELSPTCEKCEQSEADLLHSYVLCPKLQNF